MLDFEVANADVTEISADLLVLKYADGFHGADSVVARAVSFSKHVAVGEAVFLSSRNIAAAEVLFLGVGPLTDFRYERIQEFGAAAISQAVAHKDSITHLAMTIHGPGYGLDAAQSFLALIAGLVSESKRHRAKLEKITIVEKSTRRCELLRKLLQEQKSNFGFNESEGLPTAHRSKSAQLPSDDNVLHFGVLADRKPRLFVAMPFSDTYFDEYEIGFCEAARSCNFLCERLDLEHFTGDMVGEIKKRIIESRGVIALMNDHNPNVFLEIGFALAHNKPTFLVAKEGVKLPFDVSGQRCIIYRNIADLRKRLTQAIATLTAKGFLQGSPAS